MIYGATQKNGETSLVHVEAIPSEKPATVAGLTEGAVLEVNTRLRLAGLRGHALVHGGSEPLNACALELAIAAALSGAAEGVYHGELALDGTVRSTRGAIGAARAAARVNLPFVTAHRSALDCAGLGLAARYTANVEGLEAPVVVDTMPDHAPVPREMPDFAVVTHPLAQKALMVAAVTRRSVLFVGLPGSGTTMFACRLVSILPLPSEKVQLDIAERVDAAGLPVSRWRPFRAPHHTVSSAGLTGARGRLGEVDLASHGVLFLDDVPDFMREPWASCMIALRNARAKPWLVGSASPCACGQRECRCPEGGREMWAKRLAERAAAFDMVVPLAKCDPAPGIPTAEALARVEQACKQYVLVPEHTLDGVLLTAHVLALLDGRKSATTTDVAAAAELHVAITPRAV